MKTPDYAQAKRGDFLSIPIVDLAATGSDDDVSELANQLVSHAENIGFFYLTNHGIDSTLYEKALQASREFFALSQDDKSTIAVNRHQRGWMAQGMANLEGSKTYDAKEVFFWGWEIEGDSGCDSKSAAMVHPNQWPHDVAPWLRDSLLPYYLAVCDVSRRVLAALAVGLGQTADFFESAYRQPLARGQLVYYPPTTDKDIAEERFGAAEHSDFGVITLLLQDQQGGLQVRNRAGDWIEAPPIEGTLVCNIGDLLERWSSRRLVSTKHRVLNRSGNRRYSIPVFCDPASETLIDPGDFCAPGQSPVFAPVTAGEYIAAKNRRNFSQYK